MTAPAVQLRIAGPQFEVLRLLQAGEPPLVVGREAGCAVCLPDPERSLSRRHLSLWNEAGELHFQVLSAVNGVGMPFGEAPPGARGVLPAGQAMQLAGYVLTVQPQAATAEEEAWAEVERAATVPPADDVFGSPLFERTFGPLARVQDPSRGSGSGGAALAAFFRGLGLPAQQAMRWNDAELEALGRTVRAALTGLLALHATAPQVPPQPPQTADAATLPDGPRGPLADASASLEERLAFLVGGQQAGAVGPARPAEGALRELLADLAAHQAAAQSAARAAVAGTVHEFDPALLRQRLLGAGRGLFESARAWDAFVRHYEDQQRDLPAWVQQLLDRHHGPAYALEYSQARRDAGRGR